LKFFETQDVILLTSDYEGMPITILEAMSRGCIPVVTSIRSGIPEMIQDGQNGYIVPIGDLKSFADRIHLISKDLELRKTISRNAAQTIAKNEFSIDRMADQYLIFFNVLKEELDRGTFQRPKGEILIPSDLDLSWKQYLPTGIRVLGSQVRRTFRTVTKTQPPRSGKNNRFN